VEPFPSFTCDLRHGLKLTLAQPIEHVPIYALVDLLASAINHFKDQRNVRKVAMYTAGPYRAEVGNDREVFARLEISHPGDEAQDFLSTADWTDAVIDVIFRRRFRARPGSAEIGI
jgi:hypothetical protein